MPEQFEPLPVELWLREIGRLWDWCGHSIEDRFDDCDERAVRRAFHLAALAPAGISRISAPSVSLSELDALLDSGTVEEACRAVIAAQNTVNLVQSPQGDNWTASFGMAGERPVGGEGPSAVRAMVRAWAAFFMTAAD